MLRPFVAIASARPAAAARVRALHTSLPALIKIKSSSAAPPSPAERPPVPPPEPESTPAAASADDSGKPFEPQVRNVGAGPALAASTPGVKPEPVPGAGDAPLTPPAPEAQAANPTDGAAAAAPIPSAKPAPGVGDAPLTPPAPETEPQADQPIDLSSLPSLDIDPEASAPKPKPITAAEGTGSAGGGNTGKRSGAKAKHDQSAIDARTKSMLKWGLTSAVVFGLGGIWYVDSKKENHAEQSGNPFTRFKTNVTEMLDYFNKPAFDKLLPDPLPAPHQRPYTLVIDLEGLLVSSTWDRASGWKTVKRPGVDYFLAYLSQFYEIVLFTSQPLYTAAPVAEKLDPYGAYLPYKLFRDATRHIDGKTVKDLSYLNRDPSKVIVLDINEEHVALQPENAIVIKPWKGQAGDKGLVDLIPFLESIGIFAPQDVRPILKAYAGKDIPIEYAKKEAEAKQKAVEEWERKHPHSKSVGGGWLSSVVSGLAGGQPRPNQPLTYLESKRAQAQKIYQEEQKYWKDNAEEFAKLIEEDKQRQLAEMKGSVLGFITGGQGGAPAPAAEKK